MKHTLHTTPSVFDDLQGQWDELALRSITPTPFSTLAWNRAWWNAYHPGDLWVVSIEDAGQLVAIAPWFIETDGETRTLRFIGHIDVVDYMDIIIDSNHTEAVYDSLAGFLLEHSADFDQIGIANIHESSPTYTHFPDVLRAHGYAVTLEQNEVAPRINLPASYDDYLNDMLDSRERKETKRKMRKAEGGVYDITWYRVGDDHNLDEELSRFLQLMESADAEKAQFLQNNQHVNFFRDVMPEMYRAGVMDLLFITVDGEACAAYLNLVQDGHVYVYNSGLEPSTYGALSPGIVLLQYAIQDAISQGHQVFDFLRGNESYKYKMGGQDTHIYQINATPRSEA